jgi:hypothetical protein
MPIIGFKASFILLLATDTRVLCLQNRVEIGAVMMIVMIKEGCDVGGVLIHFLKNNTKFKLYMTYLSH